METNLKNRNYEKKYNLDGISNDCSALVCS